MNILGEVKDPIEAPQVVRAPKTVGEGPQAYLPTTFEAITHPYRGTISLTWAEAPIPQAQIEAVNETEGIRVIPTSHTIRDIPAASPPTETAEVQEWTKGSHEIQALTDIRGRREANLLIEVVTTAAVAKQIENCRGGLALQVENQNMQIERRGKAKTHMSIWKLDSTGWRGS